MYFHCRANQRNQRNLILGLEDDSSQWWQMRLEWEVWWRSILRKFSQALIHLALKVF